MKLRTAILLLCVFSLFSTQLLANSPNAQALNLSWIDHQVDPQQDFYKYANGSWQKQNPIPSAYPIWCVINTLKLKNIHTIHEMIKAIAKNPQNKIGTIEQKVGDFYLSGMDEAAINKSGIDPLIPELQRINDIKTMTDLQKEIAHLQGLGINVLFNFGASPDYKNSNQMIGVATQGGLGLPDRDYYLKEDKKFQEIRQAYQAHIVKMFRLLQYSHDESHHASVNAIAIETALAKASVSLTAARDPYAMYHPMKLNQLQQITPHFNWQQYFSDIGHPEIKHINLATPEFFKLVDSQLTALSLTDWKAYLRWHLIQDAAPYLTQALQNESFHMESVISGVKTLLPRWQRVIETENAALGFAVGKLYVEKAFSPSAKTAVEIILTNIRTVLKNDLQNLAWMTPQTRQAALQKLDLIEERVGYPEKWRDYSALKIDRGPYILNILRANEFLTQYELNKIGKPIDRTEWDMLPQTVNASYEPTENTITIPAGILQPPVFDPKAPAAANYGAIGFIIGHEITHAFDDEGAKFDGKGNLNNWWTAEDLKKFQLATHCIAQHFSQCTVDGNVHLQGNLVTGEATADLGGLLLAYRAFHASSAYKQAKAINGFTPDQQFFLSAAHWQACNVRPEEARRRVIIDPHPPMNHRINGTLANMEEFKLAFSVPDDSPMVNKERCVIW